MTFAFLRFSFKASLAVIFVLFSSTSTASAPTSYDFWQFFFQNNSQGLQAYVLNRDNSSKFKGFYTPFYSKAYERDLSLRFWSHIIDPTEEGTKQVKLKAWVNEAQLYTALVNTPNQAHFQKKIAMANLSFSAMNGGLVNFQFSSVPFLIDSIAAAQKARFHGASNDGFSKRVAKTQDILIASLINSDVLMDKNINEMLSYAHSNQHQTFQKPVFYEVLGTSLISSYKAKYINQGVALLAESLNLLDACTSQDCQDAMTLAPAYKIMTLLTLAEGYAMQGNVVLRDQTLNEMRA